jgi:hypothetical protein
MPLGRKHFRRSRDAPILLRKGLWPVLVVKDRLSLKTCIYNSRHQTRIELLDDIEALGDSEGNPAAQLI